MRTATTVEASRPGALDLALEAERLGLDVCWVAEAWGADAPTLIVITGAEEAVAKSFRNIEGVSVALANAAGVADVMGATSLVVSEAALEELKGRAA